MSMNSELSSRSSIQSLRQLLKIDYKKMNDGEDQTQQGSDKKSAEILDDVGVGSFNDNPLGASGTSTGSSEPTKVVQNLQALISNDPNFKLFTFNQAIGEVNCYEQPGVTFLGIFCKVNSSKRCYWQFCRKCAMLGDYFRFPKTGGGGGALKITVAKDQENIFSV